MGEKEAVRRNRGRFSAGGVQVEFWSTSIASKQLEHPSQRQDAASWLPSSSAKLRLYRGRSLPALRSPKLTKALKQNFLLRYPFEENAEELPAEPQSLSLPALHSPPSPLPPRLRSRGPLADAATCALHCARMIEAMAIWVRKLLLRGSTIRLGWRWMLLAKGGSGRPTSSSTCNDDEA